MEVLAWRTAAVLGSVVAAARIAVVVGLIDVHVHVRARLKIRLPTPRPTPRPRRGTGSRAPAAGRWPRAPRRRAARRSGAATGGRGSVATAAPTSAPARPPARRACRLRRFSRHCEDADAGGRAGGLRHVHVAERPACGQPREARVGQRRLPQDDPLDRRERGDDPRRPGRRPGRRVEDERGERGKPAERFPLFSGVGGSAAMIAVDRPSPDGRPTCRGERRLCVGGRRRWAVETGADAAMSATVSDGGAADREQPPAARATTREERTANAARAAAIGGTAIGGAAMSHRQGSLDLRAHDRGRGHADGDQRRSCSSPTPRSRRQAASTSHPRESTAAAMSAASAERRGRSGSATFRRSGPTPRARTIASSGRSCIACDDPGAVGLTAPRPLPDLLDDDACHAGDRRRHAPARSQKRHLRRHHQPRLSPGAALGTFALSGCTGSSRPGSTFTAASSRAYSSARRWPIELAVGRASASASARDAAR